MPLGGMGPPIELVNVWACRAEVNSVQRIKKQKSWRLDSEYSFDSHALIIIVGDRVKVYLYAMRMHVKVKPNSKKDEVAKGPDGMIMVRIKAPPVEGKANKYLIEFLAEYFDMPKSRISLLKGETNQYKTIDIEADEAYILNRLEQQ